MEPRPVVIDAGSCSVRAGFGGEDSYTVDFPNVIGRPRFPKVREPAQHLTIIFPPHLWYIFLYRVKLGKFGHQVNSDTRLQTV